MLRKIDEAVFQKIEFLKRYVFFENFGAFFSDFSTLFFPALVVAEQSLLGDKRGRGIVWHH